MVSKISSAASPATVWEAVRAEGLGRDRATAARREHHNSRRTEEDTGERREQQIRTGTGRGDGVLGSQQDAGDRGQQPGTPNAATTSPPDRIPANAAAFRPAGLEDTFAVLRAVAADADW